MEKVYIYYEIPSSKDSYRVRIDTLPQNNRTKLWVLSYGVAVVVIVSKGKSVKKFLVQEWLEEESISKK